MKVAGGFTLRTAVDSDLDQIGALLAARGDDADREDLHLVVDDADEGLDAVMVVTDGDRVVSTATLLRESVSIAGVTVPTGQVELVATARDHEGRGLVRALMNEAHRRSADRGRDRRGGGRARGGDERHAQRGGPSAPTRTRTDRC